MATKADLRRRWAFGAQAVLVAEPLRDIFERRRYVGDADLRGLSLGMPRSSPPFAMRDFQGAEVEGVDLSWSEFSCSFNACQFTDVNLSSVTFDSCRMHKSTFRGCNFSDARLRIVADAARFEACTFRGAQFVSRGGLEYGGRRVQFSHCDFTGAAIVGVALRAARFIECSFDGTKFERCDLRGAKFEGASPALDQFRFCEVATSSGEE